VELPNWCVTQSSENFPIFMLEIPPTVLSFAGTTRMSKTVRFDLSTSPPVSPRSEKGILKRHNSQFERAQILSRIHDSDEKIAAFKSPTMSFFKSSKILSQFAEKFWLKQRCAFKPHGAEWEVLLHETEHNSQVVHLSVNSQGNNLIVSSRSGQVLDRIPFGNISGFLVGPKTPNFARYNWMTGSPWLCFSITHWTYVEDAVDLGNAFYHQSLDIECKSWDDLQTIFWGTNQLSAKAHIFTAKRFREEIEEIKKLRRTELFLRC
jgi:hypothetical protein